MTKKWPIVLIALATAGCGGAAGNNSAAAGNAAANASNDSGGDPTAVQPMGNAASGNASGNAASGNAASGNDAAAPPYRASGTEPFWALTIGGGQMIYDAADGPDVTVATPAQQPTRAGYRYVTPGMTVLVNTFQRCEAASGAEYHDTVRVTIGAQTVTGCGGETTAAAE